MAEHPVTAANDEYKALAPFWQMIRDINGGTAAMRDAGRLYLPQEPAEPESEYFNRLSRSVFTNYYAEIVDRLIARPLKDPIVLGEDVPSNIEALTENMDMLGSDINVFARNVLKSAIDDGVTHVLVDYPVTRTDEIQGAFPDGSLSLEQEQRLGVRPYAIHIPALDLIGWKYVMLPTGRKVLTQIRYIEHVKRPHPENSFLQVTVRRIRVYEIGSVTVYEEQRRQNTKESDWVIVAQYETTLDYIPLVSLYTDRVGFMTGKPALLDLAYLNIAHWQSDSDQRNIVHIARVPILFGTGLGTAEDGPASFQLQVGAGTFTRGPKGATLEYVEHSGKGIESGINDLRDLEERMEALGVQMLVRRPRGSETATGDIIDKASEESSMGMIARSLEKCLEDVLDHMARWLNMGADAGGSVTVFKDFGVTLGADKDLELLQKDRQAGDISRMSYWNEQKRRGVLSDDFDPEQEEQLLELEGARDLETGLPDEPELVNRAGDTTGSADGHQHTLRDDGTTSDVDGHAHTWEPNATRTSSASGHSHSLVRRSGAVGQAGDETDDDV